MKQGDPTHRAVPKGKKSLEIDEGRSSKVEEDERKLTAASTAWVNQEFIIRRVVATRSTEKDGCRCSQ
jgi:hypothetical protein